MGFVKNIKEKKLVWIALIILFAIFAFLMIVNKNATNIYYRVYTDKGWSRWCKNGQVCGNGKSAIKNIEMKVKANMPALVNYEVFQNNKWNTVEYLGKKKKIENSDIYAIKSVLTSDIENEYENYYRACDEDKCYGWAKSLVIAGNKNKPITKFQIKILSKRDTVKQKIKDYNRNKSASEGFEK